MQNCVRTQAVLLWPACTTTAAILGSQPKWTSRCCLWMQVLLEAKRQLEAIIAVKLEAASSQHNTDGVMRFVRLYAPLSMQVRPPTNLCLLILFGLAMVAARAILQVSDVCCIADSLLLCHSGQGLQILHSLSQATDWP